MPDDSKLHHCACLNGADFDAQRRALQAQSLAQGGKILLLYRHSVTLQRGSGFVNYPGGFEVRLGTYS